VSGCRRRVAYLTTDRGVPYGGTKGAAVHVAEITAALARQGADVLVLAAAVSPDACPPSGVTVEILPGPGTGAAAEAWPAAQLADRLSAFDPICLYERLALHSAAGSEAARASGIPHLVEVNAPLVEEAARFRVLERPHEARHLERLVLTAADVVLPVSRPLADHVRACGARRVEVLPNAVTIEQFGDPAARPPRAQLTAVFAGSLRPWHGVEVMAEAWRRLGPSAPRLLIIGDGPGRDVLEAVGAEITGSIPHDQVPAILGTADIGIAPYTVDGPGYFSPLKVFEYLAAGLAVIAADLPGVADVIDERSGVLVPPGSVPALAAAVTALAAQPARRLALGRAGRSLVADHHTWDHRAIRVLDLADRLSTTLAGPRR